MASLGTLAVKLQADTSRFTRGMFQAADTVDAFARKAAKIPAALSRMASRAASAASNVVRSTARMAAGMAKATATMGAVLVGGLATATLFAVKKFATFDDAMRATGAVSRASGRELTMLRETAMELGRTTSFTATEVAELMTSLGRAGFNPTEIEKMTGSVLNLARGTGTDAAMSAEILSTTIRQFNLDAAEATRVADVLTATANRTMNTVEGIGDAMRYAAPIAADLGMSLEDTAAIIGTLGNVGIQGEMAGTTIRRLASITSGEAEKMERIFGMAFRDAGGNALPLIEMLGRINDATKNLGSADRMAKMSEAFGLLGITGATNLGKMAGSAQELAEELRGVQGEAARTAEQMDAGIGGTLRRLWSAIDGLVIGFGEKLAPAVAVVTDWITKLASQLNEGVEGTFFSSIAEQAEKMAVIAITIADNWRLAFTGLFKDLPKLALAGFSWIVSAAKVMLDNLRAMMENQMNRMLSSLIQKAQRTPFGKLKQGKVFFAQMRAGLGLHRQKQMQEMPDFKMPEVGKELTEVGQKIEEALKANRTARAAREAEAMAEGGVKGAGAGQGPNFKNGPKAPAGVNTNPAQQAQAASQFAGFMQRGSAAAFETIIRATRGGTSPEVKEQQKGNKILHKIEGHLKKGVPDNKPKFALQKGV